MTNAPVRAEDNFLFWLLCYLTPSLALIALFALFAFFMNKKEKETRLLSLLAT